MKNECNTVSYYLTLKFVAKIVLNYLDDCSLLSLLGTDLKFHSLREYDELWKHRIVKYLGRGHLEDYTSGRWFDFYFYLARRAIMYPIPISVVEHIDELFDDIAPGNPAKKALEYLAGREYKIKYGDLVTFECIADYRNDGKLIYDGEKLIPLSHVEDEYGNLPDMFHVLTWNQGVIFPPRYWQKVIKHNWYVWLDVEALGDIKYSLGQDQNGIRFVQATFTLNHVYTIIGSKPFTDGDVITEIEMADFISRIERSRKIPVEWDADEAKDVEVPGIPLYSHWV